MEREWRINGNARGNEIYSSFCMENGDDDAVLGVDRVRYNGDNNGSTGSSATLSPVSLSCPPSSSSPLSSIEHPVSKFDTLAGVAIKYGVEVADVKKMNGLVTDFQMFGRKSLLIPLPGRHPPSPGIMSDGSCTPGQSPYGIGSRLMSDDLKWKSSQLSAMNSLQGFYGLKPVELKLNSQISIEDGSYADTSLRRYSSSPMKNSPPGLHRKSRSMASCLLDETAGESNSGRSRDILIRRCQKSEADFSRKVTWRGLAQRPKSATRLTIQAGSEGGGLNTVTAAMGHYTHHSYLFDDDGLAGVKKSSSTSNLHDPDDAGTGTSLWSASKLKMKSDLQAFSTATVPKPITQHLVYDSIKVVNFIP